MKCYLITRLPDGTLRLLCQEIVQSGPQKGQLVETRPAGPFDTGNSSKETKALASAIMSHYFGADPAAAAEAQRKVEPFLNAFLLTHRMPEPGSYEISGDVIDRFFNLFS